MNGFVPIWISDGRQRTRKRDLPRSRRKDPFDDIEPFLEGFSFEMSFFEFVDEPQQKVMDRNSSGGRGPPPRHVVPLDLRGGDNGYVDEQNKKLHVVPLDLRGGDNKKDLREIVQAHVVPLVL